MSQLTNPTDRKKKKKKGGKIKQDSYSPLRICGARAVQFSCLEPEA